MYKPAHYNETRQEVLLGLIHDYPLGTLFTVGADGPCANHLPFEICAATPEAPCGVLRAHVARANPVWREDGAQALAVFQGPHGYISPEWYEEKTSTGKVVPTYNYAAVHAHGRLRVIDDAAWLRAHVERLTQRHESTRPAPWQVDDAPFEFIAAMLRAVVGIEIVIGRIEGKWKLSQNQSRQTQTNMVDGLAESLATTPLAALMHTRLSD